MLFSSFLLLCSASWIDRGIYACSCYMMPSFLKLAFIKRVRKLSSLKKWRCTVAFKLRDDFTMRVFPEPLFLFPKPFKISKQSWSDLFPMRVPNATAANYLKLRDAGAYVEVSEGHYKTVNKQLNSIHRMI